ncbi:protein disulfide oxidoreductase [Psychromonas sp. B3M02]|uniref:protein disulfide oxidoreductase n=1 Tax=Psychromonas sp. B3M02 TaxID=2267226 RepID=UPI000DE81B73|nr:protein disulfide oxidoreductase [Psychromonas sp. B3M02]RBW41667.1 protein disulfide oxidoreductase [Psychromonas sp. B3M02]
MTDENVKKPKKGWGSHLKSGAIYILLAFALGWGVDLWRAQSIASGKAPALVATSVQGEQVDLIAMSQEKPVLVYFWATWCSVCTTVSPSVNFVSDGMQVVSIALSSGSEERVQQYLNAKDYDFTVLNDPKAVISRTWGISLTPTLIVVDKGEITAVTTGFTSPFGMWARMLLS